MVREWHNLVPKRIIGTRGAQVGQFNYIYGLANDSNDNFYVSDYYNHRIQVFSREGEFLKVFGSPGTGNGELQFPGGISVDKLNRSWVVDFRNQRVQVFDESGQFLQAIQNDFNNPFGIAVDNHRERILIADQYNHQIQVLDFQGNFLFKLYQW